MYTVIQSIISDPIRSEAVLEKAFLTLWKDKFNVDLKKNTLFAWAISTARSAALAEIGQDAASSEEVQLLNSDSKAQKLLNPSYKKVLNLILLLGNSIDRTSHIMRIPSSSIKTRLRLGISSLRDKIDPESNRFKGSIMINT